MSKKNRNPINFPCNRKSHVTWYVKGISDLQKGSITEGLNTSYGMCYGKLVPSNWSRPAEETGHTSVDDIDFCCKQPINIFKFISRIKLNFSGIK